MLWKQLEVERNRLQTKSGLRPNCTLQGGLYTPEVLRPKGENNGSRTTKRREQWESGYNGRTIGVAPTGGQ